MLPSLAELSLPQAHVAVPRAVGAAQVGTPGCVGGRAQLPGARQEEGAAAAAACQPEQMPH